MAAKREARIAYDVNERLRKGFQHFVCFATSGCTDGHGLHVQHTKSINTKNREWRLVVFCVIVGRKSYTHTHPRTREPMVFALVDEQGVSSRDGTRQPNHYEADVVSRRVSLYRRRP